MFSDPLVTTVGETSVSLPRVTSGRDSAVYRDPNFRSTPEGETGLECFVSHMYGKRTRRTFRMNAAKATGGTGVFTSTPIATMSAYLVCDTPASGFNKSEVLDIIGSLLELVAVYDQDGNVDPTSLAARWVDGES